MHSFVLILLLISIIKSLYLLLFRKFDDFLVFPEEFHFSSAFHLLLSFLLKLHFAFWGHIFAIRVAHSLPAKSKLIIIQTPVYCDDLFCILFDLHPLSLWIFQFLLDGFIIETQLLLLPNLLSCLRLRFLQEIFQTHIILLASFEDFHEKNKRIGEFAFDFTPLLIKFFQFPEVP